MNDKVIELNRYNRRAVKFLNSNKKQKKIPLYLIPPYKFYFSLFKKLNRKLKILEIGAGTGENSEQLIKMQFNVCATDISPASVKVMNLKFSKYNNFSSKVADMEKLPFKNKSFDVVCSAGSLSYGDNRIVMNEIYRVLKIGGNLIVVDSLNDNFIYRLNRYVNYLMGRRSQTTLYRIPDLNLIDKYIKKFGYGKVSFFGSLTWAFSILRLIFPEKIICKFSNWIDKKLKIKKSAFKFVMVLKKK